MKTWFKKMMAGMRPGIFLLIFAFNACKPKDVPPVAPSGNYAHGVWVLNEGNFNYGNASLGFIHASGDSLEKNVYFNINHYHLGDVLQDMVHYNGSYYLVMNNSDELIAVDDQNLKRRGAVDNLVLPRYCLPVSVGKAYITSNTGKGIYIVDLNTMKVSGQITYNPKPDSAYASWTEHLLMNNGKVYAAAVKTGKILVINPVTDQISDTIPISIGVKDLVTDKESRIWALSDGTLATPFIHSMLYCIDPGTQKIIKTFEFPDENTGAGNLCTNATRDSLYFTYNGIYKMSIHDNMLPASSFISGQGHDFYGLGIDPQDNSVFAADASDFLQNGSVIHYRPDGSLIRIYAAGIGPNGFVFVNP